MARRLNFALPAWAQPGHPIVRYEQRHWLNARGWRTALRLLRVGYGLLILLPGGCAVLAGATFASTAASASEVVVSIGGLLAVGLFAASTITLWLNNLVASLLGATLIAREREAQTWTFLRLTRLTTLEIVGSKLAAVGYALAYPVRLILTLRLGALLIGLVTAALAVGLTDLTLAEVIEALSLVPFGLGGFGLLGLGLVPFALGGGIVVSLAAWLLEPVSGLIYHAAVGLAASTVGRSRGSAVVLVVATHFVLALAVYTPFRQLSVLLFAPLFWLGSSINPLLMSLIIGGVQVWMEVAYWSAVVAGSFIFALWRVERLSD